MYIFNIAEAKYYCSGFDHAGCSATRSLGDYLSALSGITLLNERTQEFDEFRGYALREADRLLFLTAVQYKRAHDLLSDSSCAWAHVTMYYGSFYAARALLLMFGGWIDFGKNKAIVSTQNGNPGSQSIVIRRDSRYINGLSTLRGPHRRFWDVFYSAVATILPLLPQPNSWGTGALPVSSNRTWLIDKRNEINYDSLRSFDLMCDFQNSFRSRKFQSSLPGDLRLQYQVMHQLTGLSFYLAKEFDIRTDALNGFLPKGNRKRKITERIVLASDRKLMNKSKTCRIFC